MFASGAKHGVMVRLSVLLIGFVPPLGVGIVALVNFPSAPIVALACAIMGWLLLLLAALDLRHLWLPDWLTVPLGLSGLAANLVGIGPGIGAALIGAAAGFLSLALVAAAAVAWVMLKAGTVGLVLGLAVNLALRAYVRLSSDRHERHYHPKLPQEAAFEARS